VEAKAAAQATNRCRDILHKVLRRSIELALIVAITTLQCVSWADVEDARQTTRDGRAIVAATGANAGGVARVKGAAPILLSGVVTDTFVLIAPPVSSITSRADAAGRCGHSLFELPQAPRPPPTLG